MDLALRLLQKLIIVWDTTKIKNVQFALRGLLSQEMKVAQPALRWQVQSLIVSSMKKLQGVRGALKDTNGLQLLKPASKKQVMSDATIQIRQDCVLGADTLMDGGLLTMIFQREMFAHITQTG